MLSQKNRLTQDKDFDRTFKKGQIYFSPFFNIKTLKKTNISSKDTDTRFGIVVSTKISKSAVVRNRVKRQLRAIIQKHLPNISKNYDIIILTKPSITTSKYAELDQIFTRLLKQATII